MTYLSREKIILAIDTSDIKLAEDYITQAKDLCYAFKFGLQFFCAYGIDGILKFKRQHDIRVFLDLKLHDIPNTVCRALEVLAKHDVDMLTIHSLGGVKMLREAVDIIRNSTVKTKLLGVTILTSMQKDDISVIGLSGDVADNVMELAELSYSCKLDGVVCSGYEANSIKKKFGANFLTVVPGIRVNLQGDIQDQKRVMLPKDALDNGADYLVMGRSVMQSGDLKSTLSNIFSQ
ncbi:orotidine-5'-phosphate decarboxylase [Anaplasmataceae bacterium AB001_6]|nr:orotidine-5'-phosphate decarboxylase [Anaplasmataceae bacterium AB001_6]